MTVRSASRLGAGVLPIVALTGLLFVVPFAIAAPSEGPPGREPIRTTYLADCAVCHGVDGRGSARGPTLEHAGRAGVDYWVSSGRMPLSSPTATPERGPSHYSRATTRKLVDYVVGLTGSAEPDIPKLALSEASLSEGARQFQLNCAACHASTGVGGALYLRAAPPVFPATPVQAAEAIRTGPGQMPAFGRAALSRHQLTDTVAYVEYLADPRDRGGWALWHLGPLAEGAAVMVVGLGTLLLATRWIGTRT